LKPASVFTITTCTVLPAIDEPDLATELVTITAM